MADLVLTVIGADRPGLVEALAAPIAAHGGNWLESRMAHLAGQFAGILRVEVPDARATALLQALEQLRADGLRVVAESSAGGRPVGAARTMLLDLVGLDRPGIVREISRALAQQGVNIEELSTDRTTAPMSAELLFSARARVAVPAQTDAAQLRTTLERIAGDLMVQVRLADPDVTK